MIVNGVLPSHLQWPRIGESRKPSGRKGKIQIDDCKSWCCLVLVPIHHTSVHHCSNLTDKGHILFPESFRLEALSIGLEATCCNCLSSPHLSHWASHLILVYLLLIQTFGSPIPKRIRLHYRVSTLAKGGIAPLSVGHSETWIIFYLIFINFTPKEPLSLSNYIEKVTTSIKFDPPIQIDRQWFRLDIKGFPLANQ